jgi:hypothetical protein
VAPPSERQPSLFDIKRQRHFAAADKYHLTMLGLRKQVLDAIALCGDEGATIDEIRSVTRMRQEIIWERMKELLRCDWIMDSGERRQSSAGNSVIVWVERRLN